MFRPRRSPAGCAAAKPVIFFSAYCCNNATASLFYEVDARGAHSSRRGKTRKEATPTAN